MREKVRIIFVILMVAASSGNLTALAINFSGTGCFPETGTFIHSAETDGYTAVGHDTTGWGYAWQEYNVSPEDTIWFDDFLVVGSDTLLWEQAYGWGNAWRSNNPKLRINIFGAVADWYDPGLLLGFDDLRRYYDPFNVEFLWRNSSVTIYSFDNQFFIPYIAPVADWIEIAINNRTEATRPLYSYFMPLPPQVHRTSEGHVHRRRSGTENEKPLTSIIRSLFSPESENDF